MKKKVVSLMLVLSMAAAMFAGCGSSGKDSSKDEAKKDDSKGSVYYLNFKPEVDKQWQKIAKAYTKKTGVEVKVVTAASNQYETTLKSEIAGSNAPTLFQINGPIGYESWKDYCLDLTDTDLYKNLTDQSLAVKGEDGKAYGIPYTVETYGIIYNNAIMEKYFALDGAVVKSMDEINSYDKLKEVVEDMTAKKKDLGIDGVFASTSLKPGEDWRWQTHLANLPIYYEYQKDGITDTKAIKGTYLDNYRNIWDLYINNGTCDAKQLSKKTGDDAVAEFTTEQAVFYQNGTWAYGDIADIGNDNLGMLPIYIGAPGEEKQGLCTGTENYWCVNKNASKEDIQATLDFINWCVTSEEGTKMMCSADGMGFVIPFKNNLKSENPLVNIANDYMEKGYTPVDWTFSTMPSEQWKNDLGSALTTYAADQTDANWKLVQNAFVDGWAKEAAAATK